MELEKGIIQPGIWETRGKKGYRGDGGPPTLALIGEAYGCDFDRPITFIYPTVGIIPYAG
ncbi:MAG: hypothetical protein CM1200mP35_10520 [Chloroflexota bacterium]|nr:MAG: hypothetical protein CM1200mP35_10520 [Chloroflexota bacterium]